MKSTEGPLPDFIIIGAMKSATSSLYAWLQTQAGCFLAQPKEVNFFSFDRTWKNGLGWYSNLFSSALPDALLGEASVSYTYPELSAQASTRMASVIPDVRLIYVVRDPIERLRSHYRHEVQRNRERRPMLEAISSAGNPYTATSRYFACLKPYVDRFDRSQICVVRFEDLVDGDHPAWFEVLRFLGLPDGPAPGTAHNVTANNSQWSPLLLWMKKNRMWSFRLVAGLPRPVRKLGHRLLMKDGRDYQEKLTRSKVTIPDALTDPIWEDITELERWLEAPRPLWPRSQDARRVGDRG